jgi:Holliday junction resolvasome RuvABC endonuclease subunit
MIIGIDIGTNCGWAVLAADGTRRDSGTWRMGLRPETKSRPADPRAQRWLDMAANSRALFEKWRPSVVAFEQVIAMAQFAGASGALVHGGLRAQLEIAALELDDVPLVGISPREWKKAMTGNGNADKPRYIEVANARHDLKFLFDTPANVKRHEDEAAALLIAGAAIKLGKVGAA